ncbi:hypothetical protein Gasu2_64850 [Galdieria sulphuraria]|nr:hypothetical protein Gasu2_64850 [Galdieria sulphuraria]
MFCDKVSKWTTTTAPDKNLRAVKVAEVSFRWSDLVDSSDCRITGVRRASAELLLKLLWCRKHLSLRLVATLLFQG